MDDHDQPSIKAEGDCALADMPCGELSDPEVFRSRCMILVKFKIRANVVSFEVRRLAVSKRHVTL